jgi:hypothetical protein
MELVPELCHKLADELGVPFEAVLLYARSVFSAEIWCNVPLWGC